MAYLPISLFASLCFLAAGERYRPYSADETTRNNMPLEIRNTTYAGKWYATKPGLWGTFVKTEGRAKFNCLNLYAEWHNLFDCQLVTYDSDWEDAQVYALRFFNNRFDYEDSSVVINCSARLYNLSDFEQFIQVNGRLAISPEPEVNGEIWSRRPFFRLTLHMEPLDMRSPKVLYTLIITVLSMIQIWVVLTLTKECSESNRLALSVCHIQVSKGFPLMNCVAESWLVIWHLVLSVRFLSSFNYLILAVFWNVLVLMANFKRLLPVLVAAHGRELRNTEPLPIDSDEYTTVESKYAGVIVTVLLASFLFSSLLPIFICFAYCFFVPQLLMNALWFKRNRLRSSLYITFAGVRLMLIVKATQWYWFAYPENVMMWEPRLGYCCCLTALVLAQVLALFGQNTRERNWLFAPKSLRKQQYDYYQNSGALLEHQTDCVICMTPLPLDNHSLEVVNTSKPMYSPCSHVFHEDCLRNWMRIKFECPTCRRPLPLLSDDDDL